MYRVRVACLVVIDQLKLWSLRGGTFLFFNIYSLLLIITLLLSSSSFLFFFLLLLLFLLFLLSSRSFLLLLFINNTLPPDGTQVAESEQREWTETPQKTRIDTHPYQITYIRKIQHVRYKRYESRGVISQLWWWLLHLYSDQRRKSFLWMPRLHQLRRL